MRPSPCSCPTCAGPAGSTPRWASSSSSAARPPSSFHAGASFLNLARSDAPETSWGRAIFYVDDVDACYRRATEHGLTPEFAPRDAEWGERYFHIRDPDGHELSFARPLPGGPY